MAYKDIQEFIKVLEDKGQLIRISEKVSAELEITEIADRVSKAYGKALLFENVEGSQYPVAINLMGTYDRMSMALEVDNFDEIADDIQEFMNVNGYMTLMGKVKAIPKAVRVLNMPTKKVLTAACQEVVEEPDLDTLPILKCWPDDGGKFITLPLVIAKDPVTNQQNMGMYRLQVYAKNTTGMHWHLHKDGKEIYEEYRKLGSRMPVAVAIGCDPATIYSATAPLPKMIDEMLFAGFLRKKSLPVVKCITSDLYVPANAEFILEGYVDLDELREEGPFGDHTGYYSLKDVFPVFHIEKVTRKKNPVYPATIVGKPPMEDCYIAKATERIFLPLLKMTCPEIVDMNLPLEGVFHNCAIVSIKKRFPKHAQKIMNSLWGMGQMMYTKMIIVVDENIDVQDLSTVAWKVFNNIDAKRDLVISEGPLDTLDHASNTKHYGHRLGIDATKKWASEGHTREWPDDIEMSDEIKKLVDEKWLKYGIKL